jgi:uncharacterized protein
MRFLLPGFLLLALAASPALAAEHLVTVTGEATMSVAPDTSIIRIGVTSQGKTAREASDTNAKQMSAVLAAIKDSGIADKDVQTSRLSLQPQYDPNRAGAAHLTGFQVTNQVTVKIHDIDNLPAILDRAIAAGAKVGHVVAISEVGAAMAPIAMQAMRVSGVPVAPGEQTLRAQVTVSYELAP